MRNQPLILKDHDHDQGSELQDQDQDLENGVSGRVGKIRFFWDLNKIFLNFLNLYFRTKFLPNF